MLFGRASLQTFGFLFLAERIARFLCACLGNLLGYVCCRSQEFGFFLAFFQFWKNTYTTQMKKSRNLAFFRCFLAGPAYKLLVSFFWQKGLRVFSVLAWAISWGMCAAVAKSLDFSWLSFNFGKIRTQLKWKNLEILLFFRCFLAGPAYKLLVSFFWQKGLRVFSVLAWAISWGMCAAVAKSLDFSWLSFNFGKIRTQLKWKNLEILLFFDAFWQGQPTNFWFPFSGRKDCAFSLCLLGQSPGVCVLP